MVEVHVFVEGITEIEGNDDKWDAIYKSVVGTEDQQDALNLKRLDIREIYGSKLLREIIYK